jgi:hypothetical protein
MEGERRGNVTSGGHAVVGGESMGLSLNNDHCGIYAPDSNGIPTLARRFPVLIAAPSR